MSKSQQPIDPQHPTLVHGGDYRIDGGAIFGVVPKPVWERTFPADSQNRILQATNCRLFRANGQTILIDTGYGDHWPDGFHRQHALDDGHPLIRSLKTLGIDVQEVDLVLFSHLHFDHAGGATLMTTDGRWIPTFPNAQYVTSRTEWSRAHAGLSELQGAYQPERLHCLAKTGQLTVVEGEQEICTGVTLVPTGGHTAGHLAVRLEENGQVAWYLGDLCATRAHLKTNWCMAYDEDLLQTRRMKTRLLREIARNEETLYFDHDPDIGATSLIHREDGRIDILKDRGITG